ncbi:MAG: DUF4252 domain-containing protein [Flavobacteriaceae bacterium]|jgi:hypothetical protein|nr:DUF4252 domain-containing protein [Flavobacteriaceae bacterium]
MKKVLFLLTILSVISSCGSYNSINSFYNSHKNDVGVTAIHVPQYILSLLSNSSGDMNSFMNNVRDIRYIHLQPSNDTESNLIRNQINTLTTNRFVEVYRKNEEKTNTLISVRENRDVVKEIIIYKNSEKSNSVFYLNGNFNPNTVREYIKSDRLENLTNNILQQYNFIEK